MSLTFAIDKYTNLISITHAVNSIPTSQPPAVLTPDVTRTIDGTTDPARAPLPARLSSHFENKAVNDRLRLLGRVIVS